MKGHHVDTLILDARFVVTCDDAGTVHENSSVAIHDGRIIAVGDFDNAGFAHSQISLVQSPPG